MIPRYSRPQMQRVWSEENKLDKWLQVELAVCSAWAQIGVIPKDALPKLRQARWDAKEIEKAFQETRHDMNSFLRSVQGSVGDVGRFIHLGLTSYDVQDPTTALQMVEAIDLVDQDVAALLKAVEGRALEHKDTLMVGRTHGVHAEPITFGLKLAVWVDELRRHRTRLQQAKEMVAVGKISGAVGTHATVPPEVEEIACRELGLQAAPASNQIIQRDRHAQFVLTLALIAASLEKFAMELRALQKTEVREVEEPFSEGQTGSSAMPHKRNPELGERICGLARLVRGYTVTALENVALWHERDISHSSAERIILPDACLAVDYILDTMTYVVRGMRVFPERMKRNFDSSYGLVFSQQVLLALIDKGLSRQQAYKIVQRNAMTAWETERPFRQFLGADVEVRKHLTPKDLDALFDYGYYLKHVDTTFKRLGLLKA